MNLEKLNKNALLILGLLLLAAGSLFTLQGLGILGGSAMSGVRLWAFLGPIVAIGGVVLAVRSRPRD